MAKYVGPGRRDQLLEADVHSVPDEYSCDKLDNFNRPTTSSGTWDLATDKDLYAIDVA